MMKTYNKTGARTFSERSDSFSKRIAKATRKESWHWSALNLAWTAGPVTYIALQAGNYLGYGTFAAPAVFIYFAVYTAIAGLFAVIAQFIRHIIITPRIEQAEKRFLKVVNQLFMLSFVARNEYLTGYSEDDQRIAAAWWACRSESTDVDVMEEMIRDVSGDDELAYTIKRIEFYRIQGFVDLMQREYQASEVKIANLYQSLSPKFPSLAEVIQQRFEGDPPKAGDGLQRIRGFIGRISTADEQGNFALATVDDAIAIFTLTIELLLGREIIALYPKFNGHPKLESSREKFERLRSEFRLFLRKRNGAMRAIIEVLHDPEKHDLMQTVGASSIQLRDMMLSILRESSNINEYKRRYETILSLNKKLYTAWRQLNSHESAYNALWNKHSEELRKQFTEDISLKKPGGVLTIEEKEISLSHKKINALAQDLDELFDPIYARTSSLMRPNIKKKGQARMSVEKCKSLAADILNLLDSLLKVTEPEQMLAIETSRETDFGCIRPDQTANTKASLGRTMVKEVQQNSAQVAHQLAGLLVDYLNVPLGPKTIDYLVEEYGASRAYLRGLSSQQTGSVTIATDSLRQDLLTLPSWNHAVCKKNQVSLPFRTPNH